MEQFDSRLSSVIDSTFGLRCKQYGYQYSEIIRSLMSVYFCGGSCIEYLHSQYMSHLSLHPTLRTCSADTILRAIKELTQENISYTSDTGKTFYIPANRCTSLYNDIFALRGWKTEEINGIEFELNSILRLVIQRHKRIDGVLDLWEGKYTYRCILTNDYESYVREIVDF